MKQVTGKELAKAVQSKGWVLCRIKGSHHIYTKPGQRERLVIPIHGNQPLKMGLLRALMKLTPLLENEL